MDMHELIEEQMKRQLSDTIKTRQTVVAPTPPKKIAYHTRLLGLFQR